MRTSQLLLILGFAGACGPPGQPSYPAQRASEPAHSAAAIDGEVLGVDRVPPSDRLASGVQLRVHPGAEGTVVIDLAPDWYLDEHGLTFARSERVQVEGSRVEKKSGTVIYATRIKKGGKTVELREPGSGKPLWNERAR